MEQSGLLIDNPEEVRAAVPKIENLLMSQQKFASLSRIMPARFNKLTVGIAIELKGKTEPLAVLWSASIRNLEKEIESLVRKADDQNARKIIETRNSLLRDMDENAPKDCGHYSLLSEAFFANGQHNGQLGTYYTDRAAFYDLIYATARDVRVGTATQGLGGQADWHAFNPKAREAMPEVTARLFKAHDPDDPQLCSSKLAYNRFLLDFPREEGERLRADTARSIAGR